MEAISSVLVEPITEEEQRELSVQMMSPLMEKLNDKFISSMYHFICNPSILFMCMLYFSNNSSILSILDTTDK